MSESLPTDQYSAVAAFEEWNEVTGVLPKGTGYYYECQSLFEDADAEIERLRRELAEVRAELATHEPWRAGDVPSEQLGFRTGPVCCHKCTPNGVLNAVMILCPDCGNKRCPKASDHDLPCTGSNEPGQHGSIY